MIKKFLAGLLAISVVFAGAAVFSGESWTEEISASAAISEEEYNENENFSFIDEWFEQVGLKPFMDEITSKSSDDAIKYLQDNNYFFNFTNNNALFIFYDGTVTDKNDGKSAVAAKISDDYLYYDYGTYAEICGYLGDSTSITIPSTIEGLPVKAINNSIGAAYMDEINFKQTGKSYRTTSYNPGALPFIKIDFVNRVIGNNVTDSNGVLKICIPQEIEIKGGQNDSYDILYQVVKDSPADNWLKENLGNSYEEAYGESYEYVDAAAAEPAEEKIDYSEIYDYSELEDGTIQIDKYKSDSAYVVIPGEIEGRTVSAVSADAFEGIEDVQSITIGLEHIGSRFVAERFKNCKNIEELVLTEDVKVIDSYAFVDMENLKYVEIPASVEEIGERAFGFYTLEDDVHDYTYYAVDGFSLGVYEGTAGEEYAKKYGFEYNVLGAEENKAVNEDDNAGADENANNSSTAGNSTASANANPNTGAAAGAGLTVLAGCAAVTVAVKKKRK